MLAVLAVKALSLPSTLTWGEPLWAVLGLDDSGGEATLDTLVPKENVRPPARTEKPGRDSGIGGTGIV